MAIPSKNRAHVANGFTLHANHVLAYSILNTADTALLTRLLGAYLASWYAPPGRGSSTAITVHPEDDRVRLSLGGISQRALVAVRSGIEGVDSMWRMVPTSVSASGVAYHLQADVQRDLVVPASWSQDQHTWDPDRRVGMKWAARYAVSLSHEDRMALLVLATGLTAHKRKGDTWVEYSRANLARLLPYGVYHESIERLEQRGYVQVQWGKDIVAVRWTSAFSAHLLAYMETWWGERGRNSDAETAYERAWREEHGLTLDAREEVVYDPEEDATLPWWVYVLIDPRDGKGRYIGISRAPKRRLREHVEREGTGTGEEDYNLDMRAWIAELQALGLEPEQVVFASTMGDRKEAERLERIAIRAGHLCGHVLNRDVVRQWEEEHHKMQSLVTA